MVRLGASLSLSLSAAAAAAAAVHLQCAAFTIRPSSARRRSVELARHTAQLHGVAAARESDAPPAQSGDADSDDDSDAIFRDFARFLASTQRDIISRLEDVDGSGEAFTEDRWGIFSDLTYDDDAPPTGSGGVTRVIQNGDVIEKGACSLTLIQGGKLTAERAAAISGRNDGVDAKAGDEYGAAALSIVLHTRSPMVPTFRSDVRIFLVRSSSEGEGDESTSRRTSAWFGGGADLTPYYLFDDDIAEFHRRQKELCDAHFPPGGSPLSEEFNYGSMKRACDEYFYLPARGEHRGTGGTFFDDLPATADTAKFVRAVAESWLPSWLPIVERRRDTEYGEQQRQWQLLRRGRYLEFNLLYDRGVKFGLANANPRVEGVMVSAPPLIAWEYNHEIEEGSEEERIMKVLKEPREWV